MVSLSCLPSFSRALWRYGVNAAFRDDLVARQTELKGGKGGNRAEWNRVTAWRSRCSDQDANPRSLGGLYMVTVSIFNTFVRRCISEDARERFIYAASISYLNVFAHGQARARAHPGTRGIGSFILLSRSVRNTRFNFERSRPSRKSELRHAGRYNIYVGNRTLSRKAHERARTRASPSASEEEKKRKGRKREFYSRTPVIR